jgi:hypothetical protein
MLDTLKISKALESATVPKVQAEAIAGALAEISTSDLASKSDLKDLELRLTKDINGVKDRINVILWAIVGTGVITWILQLFGSAIRQTFHLP